MRTVVTAGTVIALGLAMWGCGNGYASGSANPSGPTAPPAPMSNADIVTINVVAIDGAQSFSPSPATVPAGQLVVWHNVDTITHHVVLDDRSVDTGDLAAGASSQPMMIGGSGGGTYHCSIHPSMIGSLNQDVQPTPSCQGPYCY
jgi:plastocyanin